VLVNNAGINRRTPFAGDPASVIKDWTDIMAVNLDGMFNVTHAFLVTLRATKGRIGNIASVQSFAHMRTPNSAAYTTAITRALAAELGKDGVRVNAVGPGLIETPLNAQARANNPDIVRLSVERTPLGRTGQPEDVVGPALFLASVLAAHRHYHHGRRRLPNGVKTRDPVAGVCQCHLMPSCTYRAHCKDLGHVDLGGRSKKAAVSP
jgi:NAD(P)-dependent dehydrogenase (short-subunit alcohol dehydrogenase family)